MKTCLVALPLVLLAACAAQEADLPQGTAAESHSDERRLKHDALHEARQKVSPSKWVSLQILRCCLSFAQRHLQLVGSQRIEVELRDEPPNIAKHFSDQIDDDPLELLGR